MPLPRPGVLPEPTAVSDMQQPNATDAELMLAVANADARAFAWLMQRHLKNIVALAQRVTGNANDADEVAQEAFLRLWTHASEWDCNGKAQLRTWLSRVAVNLSIDRLRRRRSVPLEDAGEIVDTANNGYDDVRQNDTRRMVQEALLRLPARQRVVVALAYFDDMSGAEIAQVMQTSVRAVESLLVRARRALKVFFAVFGDSGE